MAIIVKTNRPLFRIGEIDSVVPDQASTLQITAGSVGRLEIKGHPTRDWIGAAFLVGPNLVLTAGHLGEEFVRQTLDGWKIDGRYDIYVNFGAKLNSSSGVLVAECLLIHPVLDVALFRLASEPPLSRPLVLDGAREIEAGTPLACFGFYSDDIRSASSAVTSLGNFNNAEKMVSTGEALGVSADQFYKRGAWSLIHDCSTVGGFGGGPVVCLNTFMVVGLHFAGEYLVGNFAVPISELARDVRVREFGVQFTSDTPDSDPDAFESEYDAHLQGERPKVHNIIERRQRRDFEVDSIDRMLQDNFSELEDALSFIRQFGADYVQTINLQPGRNRVSNTEYQRAVLDSLNRRGLINENFLSRLNPRQLLSEETIQSLLDYQTEPAGLQHYIVGSPYFHRLKSSDGSFDSFATLVRRLSNNAEADSKDALVWLIRNLDDGTEAMSRALEELGEDPLEIGTFTEQPSDFDMVDMSFLFRVQEVARSVCVVRNAGEGSSGWLIATDLVVCPAHIISDPNLDASELQVEFEDKGPLVPRTQVAVSRIESHDNTTDMMILRLLSPQTDRVPLQVDLTQPESGSILTIHYPSLDRQMLSYAGGQIIHNDAHNVLYMLATSGGSAGAPLLTQSLKVIGTHRGFRYVTDRCGSRLRVKFATCVEALVASVHELTGNESLWRRIVGAQDRLRSIDASLLSLGDGETETVVVELVDETTVLPTLEGLSIVTRSKEYVTAVTNLIAVQALANTLGVVSVSPSGRSANPECNRSLPFIGISVDRVASEEIGDRALVAVIDEGIDPFHDSFWDAGECCIDLYWDQRDRGNQPSGAFKPTETYSDEAQGIVDRFKLVGGSLYLGSDFGQLDPKRCQELSRDVLHGTAVASIAAGRITGSDKFHFCGGIAIGARLIAVRYDRGGTSIGSSSGHLSALDLIDWRATELGLPVVVNISNGENAGAHDGTSKVERRCAQFVSQPGRVIVKSAGNEQGAGRHAQFEIVSSGAKKLQWNSQPVINSSAQGGADELDLWFGTRTKYDFWLIDPNGKKSSCFPIGKPLVETLSTKNILQCSYEQYSVENRKKSRVNIRISPGEKLEVQKGEWELEIQARHYREEEVFHAWLVRRENRLLQFAVAENSCTITIPGTGPNVITVGAIEATSAEYIYEKSSHGPNSDGIVKPDLVAPGVNITAALADTDRDRMVEPLSGTSFAAPHVTGVVALALSMAEKRAESLGKTLIDLNIDAVWIRQLLVDSLDDFNLLGSAERGHGRLNAKEFLDAVEEQLTLLTEDAN